MQRDKAGRRASRGGIKEAKHGRNSNGGGTRTRESEVGESMVRK